ncbi:uncharacterized protein LOC126912312 [Spodoptera frugiperda]|uniref:Uncharacterized protein LOC126912312 n=1 Tax=Spodoptera frugiperda TaxID=7108 RepID=A0A9R0F4E0_SPOFR|nr:uncharacterized protein LOC126912312 [Spodoptera frugiperda]
MSTQPLIANELLAFIQHAIDTMDEVSILQICKSNFKEEDISSGKRLLFQCLGKLDEMPARRRDGTEKSVQDIITLLKVTDPDDVPAFVAKDLHKLPPVTFDHVDVTRLLKDIISLKTSLAEVQSKLMSSENTIGELRAELMALRNTVAVSGSPKLCTDDANICRGAANASVSSFESAKAQASPRAGAAVSHSAERLASPAQATTRVSTSTPKRAYADIAAKGGKQVQQGEKPHVDLHQEVPKKNQNDKEGFTLVERKKKRKPICRNQCATLLYVSRLHDSTEVEEIVEFIKIKAKLHLKVEQLHSQHRVDFKSFVVRVPTEHLSTFMKEEFWPRGVVYRRFRGRLPDTARHTTPSLRVT